MRVCACGLDVGALYDRPASPAGSWTRNRVSPESQTVSKLASTHPRRGEKTNDFITKNQEPRRNLGLGARALVRGCRFLHGGVLSARVEVSGASSYRTAVE